MMKKLLTSKSDKYCVFRPRYLHQGLIYPMRLSSWVVASLPF